MGKRLAVGYPVCSRFSGVLSGGPYLATNRDAANLEVHATVLMQASVPVRGLVAGARRWGRCEAALREASG
jgi:hypothetical protein